MEEELKTALISDCVDTYGYTEREALDIYNELGKRFIEKCIENMWGYWSENFPVNQKGQ